MINKKESMKQVKDKKKRKRMLIGLIGYGVFLILSILFDFEAGKQVGNNFMFFFWDMFKLFPPAFILVGLFMVWVDRKVIEKYFGEASGFMGHIAAIFLACTTLYPFIIVLPMGAALLKKGARLSIVMTYLGASAICRIPMTIFEASFLGIKFTVIRYVVALPLIIISSVIIEKMMGKSYVQPFHEEFNEA